MQIKLISLKGILPRELPLQATRYSPIPRIQMWPILRDIEKVAVTEKVCLL